MIDRIIRYIEDNELSKASKFYSRRNEDKWRRYYLMYHLRVVYDLPFAKIGRCFNLDHATVMHGLNQYHMLTRYEDFNDVIHPVKMLFPITDTCKYEPENLTKSLLTLENGRIY